jgi:23S rRNA (uracil1939-C5)-methyltransferase
MASQAHDELLELSIEKPAAGGRMIARHHGQVVLVAGAVPGERVLARVTDARKGLLLAGTVRVIEPSPDRVESPADPRCGGNVYAHIAYDRQVLLKGDVVRDALARIGRLSWPDPVPIARSRPDGYRMRARLHARGSRLGFYREGTHDLCDAAESRQLGAAALDTIRSLGDALRDAHLRGVEAVELAENLSATQRALHIDLQPGTAVGRAAIARLATVPGASGISWSSPGGGLHVAAGVPEVADPLPSLLPGRALARPDTLLRRHARSFFQGNRYLLPTLVERVASAIPDGPVTDLYAGVGLFSCALAAIGRPAIIAVEGDRTSGVDLAANARQFGGAIEVRLRSVESHLQSGAELATVILDPPRTGLSREALDALVAAGPRSLVYLSCDIATFARDVRVFVEKGYRLTSLEGFDLFPNTPHVEVLAHLAAPNPKSQITR